MSLEEQIRNNTQKIIESKENISNSIKEKGGTVQKEGNYYTFNELSIGIDSIQGGESIDACCLEELNENDVVEIYKNKYIAIGKMLPTTAIYNNMEYQFDYANQDYTYSTTGNKAVYNYSTLYLSRNGEFLIMYGQLYNINRNNVYAAIPYLKVNGKWEQLKIDGEYTNLKRYKDSTSTFSLQYSSGIVNRTCQLVSFDEISNYLFTAYEYYVTAYKLDKDNLELYTKDNISVSTIGYIDGLISYNSNLFYSCHDNYSNRIIYWRNFDTDNEMFMDEIDRMVGVSYVSDIFVKENNIIYVIGIGKSSTKLFPLKLDEERKYQKLASTSLSSLPNPNVQSGSELEYYIDDACSIYIRYNNNMEAYKLTENKTNNTISYASISFNSLFLDDVETFNPSLIRSIMGTKDGKYLYVVLAGTISDEEKRMAMLEYNEEGQGYKLKCYPSIKFNPDVYIPTATYLANNLPKNLKSTFVNNENAVFVTGGNLLYQYELINNEYTIKKSNNINFENKDVYGYGVVTKKCNIGDIVKISPEIVKQEI